MLEDYYHLLNYVRSDANFKFGCTCSRFKSGAVPNSGANTRPGQKLGNKKEFCPYHRFARHRVRTRTPLPASDFGFAEEIRQEQEQGNGHCSIAAPRHVFIAAPVSNSEPDPGSDSSSVYESVPRLAQNLDSPLEAVVVYESGSASISAPSAPNILNSGRESDFVYLGPSTSNGVVGANHVAEHAQSNECAKDRQSAEARQPKTNLSPSDAAKNKFVQLVRERIAELGRSSLSFQARKKKGDVELEHYVAQVNANKIGFYGNKRNKVNDRRLSLTLQNEFKKWDEEKRKKTGLKQSAV